MRTIRALHLATVAALACVGSTLQAKGLDTLSESAPEKSESEKSESEQKDQAAPDGGVATQVAPMEQSAKSKEIAGKLFLATSYGWVKASRSEGAWRGGGMSDLTVGYRVTTLAGNMGIDGTYRFAPVAVAGEVGENSYRGVWETHYFGGRVVHSLSPTLTAIGTAELGYVVVHLNSVDNLELDQEDEKGGAALAIGGGADWQVLEKGFALGPKLVVGFGTVTTVQVAGSASFTF